MGAGIEMLKHLQRNQPSLGAETRAMFRQGREDLLATLMGNLSGVSREIGAPGTPTAQQVSEALENRPVDLQRDRMERDR